MCRYHRSFSPAPVGRLRHSPNETLPRHCHELPFAALVLKGGYVEAGDQGRFRLRDGDVLVHHAFDSHLNRVDPQGAEVLLLRLPQEAALAPYGRVADPDRIAKCSETNPQDAARLLCDLHLPLEPKHPDWPDMLAAALSSNPNLELRGWARARGLRPETISRGFKLVYGISPRKFRAVARTRQAWRTVLTTNRPLADIAAGAGFSDQTHMTYSIGRLTGLTPGSWRRAVRRGSSDIAHLV